MLFIFHCCFEIRLYCISLMEANLNREMPVLTLQLLSHSFLSVRPLFQEENAFNACDSYSASCKRNLKLLHLFVFFFNRKTVKMLVEPINLILCDYASTRETEARTYVAFLNGHTIWQ